MSSEEKILDPSDKGPSPLLGGSVATPTGSPASTDKRPRGRPRKDAPSAAAPPTPAPRQRKKSRGRGKAVVEDEDSVDGMETAESGSAQEPDGKGQPEDAEGSAAVSSLCGEEEEQPSSSPVSPHSEAGEAETSAASGGAQSSEQLCAFCYCGARSLLGQGELKRFKATPGFEAGTEGRSHDDRSAAASQSGRSRGPESAGTDEAGSKSWDELHHVGLPDDIDVHSLFDESGQCWAHQQCALWSEGVRQAEDQSLLNVDRAIHSGSTEHCAYCKRLGASIKCCEEGCGHSYHYPCAGGAGTFQDFRKLSVLCTEHIHLAVSKSAEEANCVLCDSSGDLLDQLFCTSCGLHYHGLCLDISVTPLKRAGWQCPECKVCQTCKNPGEDTKMLVCDMCDKGYHTFCLQPVMDSIPTNGWRCKNCRVCVQCGTRSSSQWHHNSLLCENCAGQQDSTPHCALCAVSLDPEIHKDPLSCQHCKRWFHLDCERQVEGHVEVQAGEDYVCSACKHAGFEPGPLHMDVEPLQEEVEMHMEVEEATQPAPSDAEPEPVQIHSTESVQTCSGPASEGVQDTEKQKPEVDTDTGCKNAKEVASEAPQEGPAGEKLPATEPPKDVKPESSPESPQQKPDPAPESPLIQSFAPATKAELPQETPSVINPETASHQVEELRLSLEEQKSITSPTKELSSVSEPSKEEPMEVSSSEIPEPSMETEPSSAKPVPKVEEERVRLTTEQHERETGGLVLEQCEKATAGLTVEQQEKPAEGLTVKQQEKPAEGLTVEQAERTTETLTVKLQEEATEGFSQEEPERAAEGLTVVQHEEATKNLTTGQHKRTTEGFIVEQHEGAAEGLMAEQHKQATESLTVEQHTRATESLTVEQHTRATESLTVEQHTRATQSLTVEHHTRATESLTVEQHTRATESLTVEQHKRATESLTVEQHKRATESLTVEQHTQTTESLTVEQHKRATESLTVEQHKRASEGLKVEERGRAFESLTEEMDISLDGERSLAKLSSLVEERTSLKPLPIRQPESLTSSGQPTISPQSHSGLGETSSNVPSATFIPFTPKIGMGKPAISKRKFSPGRPRVKQGAWSASPRLSSPPWSPAQAEGWDAPKSRQFPNPAVWSIRVGRGSGFPGRRRPRGAGLTGRGGRGRSRIKTGVSSIPTPGINTMETTLYPFREEEENAMHSTVVIFSSTDTFTLKQDMCVVCGSFGQGVEGRLLACAQCGQCYHPYCVNIKITKVVLNKGWRCLECTVCEACGQASDPGRLLLCDDCDISYHTYCLEPPLQNVPNGSWKCKWCVSCTQCGATSPGMRCEWQNNYTQCAPCASLACCPICLLDYSEEEIILQCRQCDRWMHASCQGFHSEEEVEKVADSSFDCSLCQGHKSLSPALGSSTKSDPEISELPIIPQIASKSRDLELTRTYTQDGVCLTESGLSQLQSLANTASRRRRPKPKLKLKIINQNSVAVLQTPPDPQTELSRDADLEDSREGELVDGEGKSDSSPERETVAEDESKGAETCKKRKRKPYRPGIGGFMVRQRNRTGPGKAKPALGRKDSTGSVSETQQGKDEGWGDPMPDTPVDEKPPVSEFPENPEVKVRKRYRKKKTKLEEAFPTYLQEAFFGKDLLDKSKQSRRETTGLLEEERERRQAGAGLLKLTSNPPHSTASTPLPSKAAGPRSSEEPLVDLSEVLKSDTELLGMLSDDMSKQTEESGLDFCPFQVDCSPSPFAGLDVAPLAEEASASSQSHPGRAPHQVAEEPLDGILSPELDKMVTDESILSKLYKIPELEGKDVEDLFTAVLSPSTQVPHQTQGNHPLHVPPGPGLPSSQLNSGMFPRMPVMNGLMAPNQQFPPSQMPPGAGPNMPRNFPPMQRMPFPDNLRERKFSQMAQDAAGPWSATGPGPASAPPPAPVPEGEGDSLSTAQKSTLKWEKEETLGELATVAPVLYTNVNFPNLKEEYPDWQTRVKQIAKLWRKASSQDRAPYVQKARDNRAALRINKVQMSNETIKRQQQQQQQPQVAQALEVFDPAIPPLDPELLFKDPLKHKESEQEQEWKLRQQMRQKSKQQAKIEATQKLEQVKNEQLQQQQQQQHLKGGPSEMDTSGSLQSPVSSQNSNGNMSPMQSGSKNGFSKPQPPGTPTSGSPDDVFLRPHPPPPSSGSQPQSPQMFSPGSSGSRPSSPWDPYTKMVGTPRPPPSGPAAARRNSESGKSPRILSEECGKASSVHEPIGSPTALNIDPYAKPPDTPRPAGPTDPFLKPMCPPRSSQAMEGRHLIGSPGHDPFSRAAVRKEAYPRMPQGRMILSDPYARPLLAPIPGSNESGSVQLFKTPMPPPQAQESNTGIHSRRPIGDPFERPMMPPRSTEAFSSQQNDPYAHPPLTPHPVMGDGYENQARITRQPQAHPFSQPGPLAHQSAGNPYARTPSTPRPDYSQCDPFSQTPFSNPYARMPGTPRPHDPEPYAHQSATSHPVIMNQPPQQTQTQNRILSPMSMDPYAQPPGTPHPGMPERFLKSQNYQRNQDPFNHPPGMSRQIGADPHTQPAGASQALLSDPYAQPPRTPHPGGAGQVIRPGPMPGQDSFSPPQALMQDAFASPAMPGSQTPRHPGMADENSVSQSPSSQPSHTPVHDPFEQVPMNPHPQCPESREQQGLGHGAIAVGQPNTEAQTVPLAEAEERLRQRQRIRELILRQQQQKSAIRQEKSAQEQPVNVPPGTPQHWSQETQGQQTSDLFNRPPPPYPGPGAVRSPQRFHGPYPGDPRGSFPDGQFPKPQFPGDTNNIRQPGPRLSFPPGVQGPGLRPHQMQDSMMEGHPQMRRSMSIDLGKSLGGNPMGLQPLPPRGMHMQQHNIMGQPFIELRHRPPEARLRIPFAGPVMQGNRMESPTQPQRPPGLTSGQEMGFPANQGPKPVDPAITQTQGVVADLQGTMSMESLHQPSVPLRTGHPQIPLMRSMSQPASNETFSGPASSAFPAVSAGQNSDVVLPTNEGSEEKIDADESAVKDLEDVEVKDLVDTDLENLNLDTDDGKDLDLETNDLHLEEIFLTSGKFDIIAYTDADLDLSEDLDLNDPIDDHTETSEPQKSQTGKKTNSSDDTSLPSNSTSAEGKTGDKPEQSPGHIKKEVSPNQGSLKSEKDIKIEVKDGLSHEASCKNQINETKAINQEDYGSIDAISQIPKPGIHPDATPVLSSLLVNVPPDNESHKQDSCGQSVAQSKLQEPGLQQTVSSTLLGQGAISVQGINPGMVVDPSLVSSHSEGPLDIPGTIQDQSSGPIFGVDQKDALLSVEQTGMLSQSQQALLSGQGQQNRPLLLEEQPLLLQDLLDQERQEQQQQKQMQAMIRQRSSDSFFPNIDFDAITDPIMKAKMVALKGINKVMVQNNMGMSQMVMNKFPVAPQQGQGPQGQDGCIPPQQAVPQDGKLAAYMTRPSPPSFGQGFTNEAQKVQYEDWLRETQKLLQMQQKFLEEQIGAHRKSKKALSAKQRTAKKAGREFPEEDAEQLKHVTEQQGVVQKQLEQIRKQQKEHAELIEEYRVKQQQGGMQPQMMPGMLPMQGHPGMVPSGPVSQALMGPAMPMQVHPGQANAPSMPAWHPGASGHVGPQMPGVMPPQMMQGQPPPPALARAGQAQSSGESPHVNFDDTNPFSESFQERERKERLREQQERQRVQLMKEVERQRMKQRMEMEQQQGLISQDGNMRTLSQMPFYNQNLPQDFMQPHRSQQQIQGPGFPQQQGMQGMQPGLGGPPSGPIMGNGPFPQEVRPGFGLDNQVLHGGPNFVQGQPRPPRFPGPNMVPQNPGQGHPFGVESTMPLPPNFPGSGPSLIQLYSNIIPEEKGKKKQSRKKKKDDDTESLRAPSTPHSDLTAPLTPCVSDTSSTPTRNPLLFGEHEMCETSQPGSSTPGSQSSQPHSELERQLSEGSCVGAELTMGQQDIQDRILSNIKMERIEASDCHGPKGTNMDMGLGMVKVEVEKGGMSPLPAGQSPASSSKGEGGNELLKHLLKNKGTPPSVLPHQKSEDSLRSEEEASADSKVLLRQSSIDSTGTYSDSQLSGHPDFAGSLVSEDKKKQRTKRTPKSGERPAPRSKKRKKEEDERQVIYPSTEPIMANLKQQQQLTLLPLMEPLVGVNFAHFVPYGSGQLDGESRLSGAFGSASLDGMSDYYSQLIYKQNNLSNPPTPPASLPPTPPPVARQKLLNGFATTEELASKAAVISGHDVTKGLPPRPLHVPFKTEEELFARALAHGPKTVDVPASLPTPPHNNQEEIRGQEHCEDRDTPDSFVPSSSPESVVGMEISRYPDLSRVKQEPPSPALSPVMPMFPSRGKGSEAKLCNIKTEPSSVFFGSSFGAAQNGSGSGLVSIAITLKPAAAENITDVVAAIADLIQVKIPSSYEVSSGPWPHAALGAHKGMEARPSASGLLHGHGAAELERLGKATGAQGPLKPHQHSHLTPDKSPIGGREQYQEGPGSPGPKPQWCRQCKVVVLGNGVKKPTKDQQSKAQESQSSSDGDLVFCSHSCLILHSSAQAKATMDTKASVALLEDKAVKGSPSKAQHQYNNNMSSLDVHCLAQLQSKPSSPSPNPLGPALPASLEPVKTESVKTESNAESHLKMTVKLKPRSQSHTDDKPNDKPWHHGKRWKGLHWRKWTIQIASSKAGLQEPEEDLRQELRSSLRPCSSSRDRRRCCFCQQEGDGLTDGAARLLNLDLDTWVHLNCALWSSEVYETQAGALINVEVARQRGQTISCAFCQRLGATSGCHRLRCLNVYHFTCALQAGCTFFKDKTMLCHQHRPRGGSSTSAAGLHLDQQVLRCFSVFRRVYVQRDELRQLASAVQRPELGHTFRVGSLIFHAMGQLPPALLPHFHSASAIFPPGYEASRLYWSMRNGRRRCRYVCSVEERQGRPEFSIRVLERGYEDLVLTDTTAKGVWDKVLGSVAERRAETGMLRLFPLYLKGEDLFGLTVSVVARIAESLPGVEACSRYRFRYGRNPLLELPLCINPSGSARSELRSYPQNQRLKILSVWNRTSCVMQNSALAETGPSHSKHFVHSKSSQYRRLTSEWKSNVYLAHSRIQGLGLFAARDIEKQTMVIEYLGEILRTEVAMRKELHYKAKNRKAFMFHIDGEYVIDATCSGSPARYINHSCSPNCVAEVVTFERGYKIIISSSRRIEKGEELCYDYKLGLVRSQNLKMPCLCGAVNCRKWMN
ncbi:histone-lysine N-methyltransferase 2C isoform X2 [Colossoma macropomum]|uniref:histone-lysine N-methyltransferase 2C isoform X2 n=1 Tax=Colossoma macropomum TaxID=42526 RepID=UPI00186421F5|nr:histone-lysine N-methyltransferase 2C isoform X2 [Colossoma macropomum]